MSIQEQRYPMPQPEQWLSEYSGWTVLFVAVGVLLLAAVIGWLA